MGGCFGWMGRVGIKETATGERVPEHGAIPDLNICRDGRKTYVLLDANCATNSKVQQACAALVRQLRKQGADVAILDLPSGDGINGPDDCIGIRGDDAMTAVFEGAGEGEKVLNETVSFLRQYVILSEAQAAAIALWIAHTYTFKSAAWSPYLNVSSAAPECGKSLLLETLEFLVRKPWKVDGASPAVLFRKIELDQPTLLFDELDTTFKGDKETAQAIRQVLNAGAKYNGRVARCVGEHHTPKDFRVFCPKVLAGIGDLPPTVSSRSLPIVLGRKLATEKVDYLDHGDLAIKGRAAELRNRLYDWIEKRAEAFRHATPDFPEVLTDRQKDGSRILLLIADAAGGEWQEKSRRVLCELYQARPAEDTSVGIQILHDVRLVFDELGLDRIATAELVQKLVEVETSPWAEWNRGKPMTPVSLSRLLKPFRIFPKTIRFANERAKGYERASFADSWDRYLPKAPSPPTSSRDNVTNQCPYGENEFSTRDNNASVTDRKSASNPHEYCTVTDVTGQKGGEGHRDEIPPWEDLELPCPIHGRHRFWWIRTLPAGGETVCGKCEPKPEAA
jgi:Protein of unknown function (DUF3631)/Domain of unknown function (DUF3854)